MSGTVLAAISKDEHERAKRMSQRKWETDMTNNILVAEEKGEKRGEKKGRAKGKKEGRIEVAHNLKKLKTMTNKEIAELTGLSVLEIEKL